MKAAMILLTLGMALSLFSLFSKGLNHYYQLQEKAPVSVPVQKAEPAPESTTEPKPFSLGRYGVENLA